MEGKAEGIAVKVTLAVSKVNVVPSENNIAYFNDILLSLKGLSRGAEIMLDDNDDKVAVIIDDLQGYRYRKKNCPSRRHPAEARAESQ